MMLLIDTSTSNLFGTIGKRKKDLITEMAAILTFSAINNNDKVGVIFFSNRIEKYIPPKKGRQHALYIVRELLTVEPHTKGTNLDAAIKYFNNTTGQKSIAFLLSDFLDTGYDNDLKVIGKKHDVIGIKVYDKMDLQLPDAGLLQLEDAETGKIKWVDSSNELTRYNYQQNFFLQTETCKQYFLKAGADLLHIRTDEDYVKILQKFFFKTKINLPSSISMIIKKYIYHSFLFLVFCCAGLCSPAQSVSIKTDRNQLLIGERITYELLISLPGEGYAIRFNLPDSVPHFDFIEKGYFDTTSTNGALTLHKKIIFTSFDSGAWYIPALPVSIEKNTSIQNFMTDSVLINVGYADADSSKELRDIKPIMEVEVKDYFWLSVAGLVLSLLIIIFLLYRYFKKRKERPVPVLHSALSPYDEAMNDLKELSAAGLILQPAVKQYHTQLAFILKRYYSRVTENNLLNKTTGDLLLNLKEQQVEAGLLSSVAEALRIGDAVKFAKYIPPLAESENSLAKIKEAIEKIEKNKPNINQ